MHPMRKIYSLLSVLHHRTWVLDFPVGIYPEAVIFLVSASNSLETSNNNVVSFYILSRMGNYFDAVEMLRVMLLVQSYIYCIIEFSLST